MIRRFIGVAVFKFRSRRKVAGHNFALEGRAQIHAFASHVENELLHHTQTLIINHHRLAHLINRRPRRAEKVAQLFAVTVGRIANVAALQSRIDFGLNF